MSNNHNSSLINSSSLIQREYLATGKCSITIDTTVPDSEASWYDLWQAAVALDGMCARAGKMGKARFLGQFLYSDCCSGMNG